MAPEALKMVANKNVEQIAKLESEQVEARTLSERIAGRDDDRIAGGDCSIDDDPDGQNQMSRQADRGSISVSRSRCWPSRSRRPSSPSGRSQSGSG